MRNLSRAKIFICFILVSSQTFKVNSLLAKRRITFDDPRSGIKLVGQSLEVFRDVSRIRCAKLCTREPKCLSYNYFSSHYCELNAADVFTREAHLSGSDIASYVGMSRDRIPRCSEKDHSRDIQDDSQPNFCQVNLKRQDEEWSPWADETVIIDNSTEWKKEAYRVCYPSSHGGTGNCEDPEVKILEWNRWVHDTFHFDAARNFCSDIKGVLFHDLNGTKEQLDFFYDKLKAQFYVGVKTEDRKANELVWKTVTGEVISDEQLFWGYPEPLDWFKDGSENVVAGRMELSDRSYLSDVRPKGEYKFVCDMRPRDSDTSDTPSSVFGSN